MSKLYFIADLHLSTDTVQEYHRFADWLPSLQSGDRLYILGDFLEVWVGDDDLDDPFARQLTALLHHTAARGVSLFLQHGNRDFLLGERFAQAAGLTLLPDPCYLPGEQLLLSHGDQLCLDDHDYQRFRAEVRQPQWQQAFLARPLSERKAFARQLREQSEAQKRSKPLPIMDVADSAVQDWLARWPDAILIHGHTHRAAQHRYTTPSGARQRWVLPDWHAERWGFLQWQAGQLQAHYTPPLDTP
ncbi:UDP-2,3-diacylglucosamine diphosphatase [Leeia aquatica]|uniref:UDP-2,3-diacylglucosamine hydrolase n=1 Tax=Leeia aquatica TaxID=2725557 RepID=A0A847SC38_9NEIS|nr:UDP-2,3-diacylglucosamine diphosphatase [Leeia aquatica]NLR75066.1 UDP-2,3-diacylglucosamine diphosphatase [Leeia aquatica]